MWLFLSDAFFSIVADDADPDRLLVRARFPADIRRVFPNVKVRTTPDADYRYRASVSREVVARALSTEVCGIRYRNFKDTVPASDRARHDAYLRVWSAMYSAQRVAKGNLRTERGSRKQRVAARHPRFEDNPGSFETDSSWWVG